ncbi:hypothetical protein JW979_03575 [bacterium]|nr:hypothetical protein [candidate division CSSED10-310 bacterium]
MKKSWQKFKSSVSKAFRVEAEEPFQPNPQQEKIIRKLAEWVVRKRLTVPAIMFLESVIPLNYIGSQVLVFFNPFVTAFLNSNDYSALQEMLEDRGAIPVVIEAIETQEKTWEEKRKSYKASKLSKKE